MRSAITSDKKNNLVGEPENLNNLVYSGIQVCFIICNLICNFRLFVI